MTINYKEWNEQLVRARKAEAATLAHIIREIAHGILKQRNFEYEGFEHEDIGEVAIEATRDHQRLLIYQSGKVDPVKFAAYVSFWFRKVQPIWRACAAGPSTTTKPRINDINERISLYMLAELLEALDKSHSPEFAKIRRDRFEHFFNSPDFAYVVKSMRHRTFGPHHFVMLANSLLNESSIKNSNLI